MNCLLFGLTNIHLSKLQRVQHATDRLITDTKMREHITPVLMYLHWLPIKQRINYKILLFTFKSLNGLAPKYVSDMIQPLFHTWSLRSSSKRLLSVPRSNSATHRDKVSVSYGTVFQITLKILIVLMLSKGTLRPISLVKHLMWHRSSHVTELF